MRLSCTTQSRSLKRIRPDQACSAHISFGAEVGVAGGRGKFPGIASEFSTALVQPEQKMTDQALSLRTNRWISHESWCSPPSPGFLQDEVKIVCESADVNRLHPLANACEFFHHLSGKGC